MNRKQVEIPEEALHAANTAGYEANYEGILLRDNPHQAGSPLANAWEAGHLQAQDTRDEWEADIHGRAMRFA